MQQLITLSVTVVYLTVLHTVMCSGLISRLIDWLIGFFSDTSRFLFLRCWCSLALCSEGWITIQMIYQRSKEGRHQREGRRFWPRKPQQVSNGWSFTLESSWSLLLVFVFSFDWLCFLPNSSHSLVQSQRRETQSQKHLFCFFSPIGKSDLKKNLFLEVLQEVLRHCRPPSSLQEIIFIQWLDFIVE